MKKLFFLVLCAAAVCSCFNSGPKEVTVNANITPSDNLRKCILTSVYYRVSSDTLVVMCDTLPGGQWSKVYQPQEAYLEFQFAIDTLPGFGALAATDDSIYYSYGLSVSATMGSRQVSGSDGFRAEPGVIDADSLYHRLTNFIDTVVYCVPLFPSPYVVGFAHPCSIRPAGKNK